MSALKVRRADDLVGMLVGNDKSAEGDETDDDLEPGDGLAEAPPDEAAPGEPYISLHQPRH